MLYETTFIIDGYLQDERQAEITSRVEDRIKEYDGEIVKTERMGKRRLAYEIRKKQHGYYNYVMFESDNVNVVSELERECRFNEGILRYLTVRVNKVSPQYKSYLASKSEENAQEAEEAAEAEYSHSEPDSTPEEPTTVESESSDAEQPSE